ncbi:MAG: DUF4224 domain-containing protein [Salinisphaera sp.]|jgi:hypothetical protein|nr:DUF4224 domain-containing protein [Salinisphaera sp.]
MAVVDPIVTQEQLMSATGYERAGDLEKWLRRKGIKYHRGKGNRVFTTVDALNGTLDDVETADIEFT